MLFSYYVGGIGTGGCFCGKRHCFWLGDMVVGCWILVCGVDFGELGVFGFVLRRISGHLRGFWEKGCYLG